ncbi:MAG: ZIP family metal transporter [Eggerthellaceae bacterium]|jgi:ZIP family zinc transporter
MPLLITFLLGLFILLGAFITKLTNDHRKVEQVSIAVAFGALTTLALADLLPEAQEHLESSPFMPLIIIVCILAGIGVLRLLDHFIPDHDDETITAHHDCSENNTLHIGIMTTIAVTLHNLIEGMTVYSVSAESLQAGLLVALGVGLHNVPMGMIIFATLEQETRGKKAALMSAAILSTFVGGLLMNSLWFAIDDFAVGILISLTLGMIAYLVLFELLPHMVHSESKKTAITGAIIGMAIVLVSVSLG